MPFRRIVHPTDFSRASQAAFGTAVELARANRAALTILHVITPLVPMIGEGYAAPQLYERMLADAQGHAGRELQARLARARKAGVRAKGLAVEGLPHDRIVQTAKRLRADLIVIGTHGRTGLARFFLGSVASRVVATAPCPVLTVRGR
jgi:nucleotide-binding universal stress UspA family protein